MRAIAAVAAALAFLALAGPALADDDERGQVVTIARLCYVTVEPRRIFLLDRGAADA